ncbi:MAG: ABC transporter ATP-binding protein [Alphaproteobacteria bacterium]|nr:ABC transporter ATP-binding protein [Alphaproteobacteria bacterium]MDA7983498.1 ABC transporter ATP-binding protein [Alphaproteobacteria bacterium]MDA7989038.1 ABC transporter ATP-binding protein [Alphaproteobacteria bacterium]MDA8000001.1 ABC transporter ATP-binding protein [Alphaproteobacteria bacterium]MDA8003456.1 ABC transporter ATP-binding protein [Alphaproteobacteria bacterium]
MTLLQIQNLSVDFRSGGNVLHAVDNVSMTVNEAEVLAIVGESGSGKSVAMLAVMGLLPNTAEISAQTLNFNGQDLRRLSPSARRRLVGKDIAMIFQEPMTSLNPCFTVGFQLRETLRAHLDLSRKDANLRALELLEEVGISAPRRRMSSFPHQLSGGMNQRVMIAMALACKPKLLIADEPTTALDVTIQAQILDLLLRLQQETGMALVLITHSMGVVAETADRVCVQYAGRKMEEQSVAALFAEPRHPYTSALLTSLPERTEAGPLPSIPGVVPGLHDRPRGCLFSPRCAFANERCRSEAPAPASSELGFALCHTPLVDGEPLRR